MTFYNDKVLFFFVFPDRKVLICLPTLDTKARHYSFYFSYFVSGKRSFINSTSPPRHIYNIHITDTIIHVANQVNISKVSSVPLEIH